jgi:23S rRNA (cytosine1962-C5)-methyltransferase
MPTAADFENRLKKNLRHLSRWAVRAGHTCYRVYDKDVPEFPYAVDWYDGRVQLVEFPRRRALARGEQDAERAAVLETVSRVLAVPPERISVKTHLPQPWGRAQYGRTGDGGEFFTVVENGLRFRVNLGDYLDTGLFMDHRDTRARVRSEARGKRVLNLFAYTGAFSVYAAAGGAASTTSVDLSNTYCDWAQENLALNGHWDDRQEIIRGDVLQWMEHAAAEGRMFDLVVLDPPSFSTSKKMERSFNVQRDQLKLLAQARPLLAPGGVLYFSTNFRGFELKADQLRGLSAQELTPASLPQDFHDKAIHRCWRMTPG